MNSLSTHAPKVRSTRAPSNAALLIDFDNVTMGIRSDLQTQLRRLLNSEIIKGKVAVQRAYADWRRYPQYIAPLSEASIDLIYAPAFGSNKKNATDIRLAIDALELVFTRPEIGTFILMSGDSDFSSLVLKLKEYGKYVIGVGIRESASDLLVQNCHEYYSYGELTGLSRTDHAAVMPRDPWELVVEAVLRMQANNDVMRSDRLKQVMQDLDPHFDEKDAGVSKFSRFVLEAARRGLLVATKLENGQFAIGVGPDANVPPPAVEDGPEEEEATARPARKPSTGPNAAEVSGMPLGAAFRLLKRSMEMIGAIDEESTDADQVRELMIQLADTSGDPIFEGRRFHRFLRQAHDASAVELVKSGDSYLLKLNPEAAIFTEDAVQVPDDKPVRRKKTGTRARPGRTRSKKATSAETTSTVEGSAVSGSPAEPTAPVDEPAAPGRPAEAPSSSAPKASPEPPLEKKPARPKRRGVGARTGSRGRKTSRPTKEPAGTQPADPPAVPVEPAAKSPEERKERSPGRPPRGSSAGSSKTRDARRPQSSERSRPAQRKAPPEPRPEEQPAEPEAQNGGLFKRVSSAVQRALLGDED